MNLSKQSAWSESQISDYLDKTIIPIRLAVPDGDYPLLCSVWYRWDQNKLYCASHKNSYLVSCLERSLACGFEIAADQPPYRGVRGKARVSLLKAGTEANLKALIEKYQGDKPSELRDFLLSRVDDEYVVQLEPVWVTSWDYSKRMGKS